MKNLKGHDRGRTFATIMHVLETELNYNVSMRIVDASPWVPQRRERVFIVGFEKETDFDFAELEIPSGDHPTVGSILDSDIDPKYTLSDHLWTYLQDYKRKHRAAGNGFGYSVFGPGDVARTLSARYYKDGSEILIRQNGRPRRLTPRECARLMGFDEPDGRVEVVTAEMGVSRRTGFKWLKRFREQGEAGLEDRSSRPHRHPRRIPRQRRRQIERLKRERWSCPRIANHLQMPVSLSGNTVAGGSTTEALQ